MLKAVAESGHRGIEANKLRFAQLADIYREHKIVPAQYHGEGDAARKVAGLRSYESVLVLLQILIGFFGNQKVKDIRHSDLERFKRTRLQTVTKRGKQRSLASVNRELEVLRAILNFAKREGYVSRSPFELGEPLISKADETKRERVLSFDEEARLLAAIDAEPRRAHLRPIVIAALDTACRRGELLKLEWRDVDLPGGLIIVRAINAKTAKTRIVPITPRLAFELEKLLAANPAAKPTDCVFGGIADVKKAFVSACRAAKITGVRLHDLRHTAITRMIRAGVPMPEAMRISGHDQITTFLRYLNPTGDALRSAADALTRLLAAESGSAASPGVVTGEMIN
jgi:integrase